jgi:methanethiol S-methyltransferase
VRGLLVTQGKRRQARPYNTWHLARSTATPVTRVRTPDPPTAATVIAWLGGVVFVAALGVGAWFYAVELANPGSPDTPLAAATAWNVLLFAVFASHHSLMARSRAKAWLQHAVPPAFERSLYVWLASLLFVGVCVSWQRVPGTLYAASGPVVWALTSVQLLGVVVTVAGARVLDFLDLAGIRQATHEARPLVIRAVWPFTLVRHPIYLGWVLMVFGATPMTVDRAVWAVISTAYLVIAMPWEERSLAAAAGPAYLAYCRKVRWRLVPGVY